MKRTAKGKPKIDWSRVDAMTEAERHAAAMADPDARPMTDAEWARAPRVPQVSIIRRALRLAFQGLVGSAFLRQHRQHRLHLKCLCQSGPRMV